MTRIIIEAIAADKHRLPAYQGIDGAGDWYFDPKNGDLHICVTGTDVFDQNDVFLVALHELIEAKLCACHGVTQGAVDAFDAAFESDGEAGDDPAAPYQKEHRAAMLIEHSVAMMLGIWDYGEVR